MEKQSSEFLGIQYQLNINLLRAINMYYDFNIFLYLLHAA